MCFDQLSKQIIAQKADHHTQDALNSLDCSDIKTKYIDQFNADTKLIDFLTESTLDLPTTGAPDNDTEQRKNLCNPNRVVNLATLYSANAFGINVGNLIKNFNYDLAATYVFPNNSKTGPKVIYPPVDLAAFPNLEQAYWTILSQFTIHTEPNIRKGKSNMYCHHYGVGVYYHCQDTNSKVTKCTVDCKEIWANFLEVCHRIQSLDTSTGIYQLPNNFNRWCLPNWLLQSDYTMYYLYRR